MVGTQEAVGTSQVSRGTAKRMVVQGQPGDERCSLKRKRGRGGGRRGEAAPGADLILKQGMFRGVNEFWEGMSSRLSR